MLPRAVPNNVKAPTAAVSVPDPAAYIRARLKLAPIPALPGICLYLGQPESGLGRFTADHNDGRPPYWAYPWSGGLALAQYLRTHPDKVRGKRVLDLGAGGGVVAVAAAQAGAAQVTAADIDPAAAVALALNAAANAVEVGIVTDDLLPGDPPDVDLVLVGDLFYAADLAAGTTHFLARCRAAGIEVLVGDPGRPDLPNDRLTLIARYEVPEVGSPRNTAATAAVYAFD